MTCMRSGNRWMLDVEQQQTSRVTLWQSTFSSSAPRTNSSITPTSSVPTCLWSSCCEDLFLWHVSLSISRFSTPLIYCCLPLSLPPTLSTCMLVFSLSSFCHHATWDPVKATSGERWTSGCCLVPTHVYSDFGAKSLCDFTLDAKAFCSACHNQFKHYYKVKHQSPSCKGFLLAVSLHFASLCMPITLWFPGMIQYSRENWCPVYFISVHIFECTART